MRLFDGEGRDGWRCTIRQDVAGPAYSVHVYQMDESGRVRAWILPGPTGFELHKPVTLDDYLPEEPTFRIAHGNIGAIEALQEALTAFKRLRQPRRRDDGAERELEATQRHLEDARLFLLAQARGGGIEQGPPRLDETNRREIRELQEEFLALRREVHDAALEEEG